MSELARVKHRDPVTGATISQWTHENQKSQHLYFTSPSVSQDGRWLLLISERTGSPNLFAVDRSTGAARQLSDNSAGLLRAYCYPQGGERGLNKASPSFDPWLRRVYYIQDDQVMAVHVDSGDRRILWRIPDRWWTAFTHVSRDGRWLCVPCTDPAAFEPEDLTQWDQLKRVPQRMKDRNLRSRVFLVDTQTGDARLVDELPFWVTHVNIDPTLPDRIAINSEGDARLIPEWSNRIYCLERGRAWRPLFNQPKDVVVTHENWAPDGSHLIYHGSIMAGNERRHYLAARRWDGSLVFEYQLGSVPIAHATPAEHDRALIADTTDGWIVRIEVGDDGNALVQRLCRHDSDYHDQDAHPHPMLNPAGNGIVFTSVKSGTCQVYEIELAQTT